ncbi:MAG: hypothetical protein Q8P69_00320 [bacterium]|nr:hypothetical protein [bacterium]
MALGNREKWRNTARKLSPEEIQKYIDYLALRALKRGYGTEDFVEKAIKLLKSKGWLKWYHRSQHGDTLDNLGVDFLLMISPWETIPLQVKSSELGKQKHIAEYGNTIPCVVLYPRDTVEMMSGKIMMVIFPDLYEEGEPEEIYQEPLRAKLQEMLD